MSYQQHRQHHAVAAPRPRRPGPGAYEYAPAAPAPAAAATARYTPNAPTPMTGRVIVDRTSFDSEDHVTSNHFAPHSSASTGGPSLASFHGGGGGAAPGHGTAGAMHLVPGGGGGDNGKPSAAPAASSAPPRKLRRRKMKWKPRLPSSSGTPADNTGNATSTATGGRAASCKVTFQRATDDSTVSPDDMSYIGGGGGTGQSKKKGASAKYVGGSGGGQASIASTNATPRQSNQAWAASGSGGLLAGLRARSRANHATLASGDDNSTLATLETPVHRTGGGGGGSGRNGTANVNTGSNRNSVSITDSDAKFTPYGERQRGRNNVVTTTPNKFWAAAPGGTSGRHQMASSSAATPGDRSTSSTAPLEESFTSLDHSGYSTPSRGRSSTGGTPRDEKHPLPPRVPPMDIMGGATPPRHSRDRISPASSQRMRALSLRVENNSRLSGAASSVAATNDVTAGRNQPDNSTTSVGGGGSGSCNLFRLDGTEGISLVGADGSSKMVSVSPISRELAMLQAQSEGNVLTPSRQQQGQAGDKPAKGAPPPLPPPQAGTSRSRFASAAGPVDVDSAQFTDAERHLRAIHEMGAEHLIHGEFDEAVEVFTEILRGQMERHGPGHPRVGTALHNLGICHLKKGDYASAIRVCRDAVEIRKAALGGRHPDVAVSLAQLGIAHLECGQHRKALVAFREALQIRRMLLGPKHPKVARLLNNTGCALFELNEMRGAMLAFEETLDIQRSMMKSPDGAFGDDGSGSPSTSSAAEQLLLSTAATLCNIGSIRLRLGDADGAIVALEEALLVQQSVLGDDHQIVLATADSIGFIESKRGKGSRHASGNSSLADDNFPDSPGCAPPPLLSRMINANVVQSIGAGGKSLFQRMDELTLEPMACGGGIDRSDAETQFSI